MSGFEEDLELEERLRLAALRSPTPELPEQLAALPWTVQRRRRRRLGMPARGGFSGLRGAPISLGHGFLSLARLAATVALAGGFLLLLSQSRLASTDPGAAIVPPAAATAVSPAAGSPSPSPSATGTAVTPTPGPAQPAVPAGSGPLVIVLPTSGVVDDVMADYISGGIHQAESDGAAAVIVQLDTPGGSGAAMQRIYQSLYASGVPTIVWVGPSGARAASAGTFITLAANLAYMASSTNIGAASPVAAGGQDIAAAYGQTEAAKTMNDAVKAMTGIALKRHPDAVEWAVSTVQEAKSYTAQEAIAAKGVNGMADTIAEVLAQADGQRVPVANGSVTLAVKNARVVTITENLIQSILHTLDDPNIAFILLVLGVGAIILELFHPTLLVGLLGALALALSFYGSGSLPLNVLGVALVGLGLGMLILEVSVPSHGLLTVGGLICFVVGAVAFYGSPGPYLPNVQVALPIIVAMTAAAAAYALIVLRTLYDLRRRPLGSTAGLVGSTEVVGRLGRARTDLAPLGTVYVAGESWSARPVGDEAIPHGAAVRVVERRGLTLVVEPIEEDLTHEPSTV